MGSESRNWLTRLDSTGQIEWSRVYSPETAYRGGAFSEAQMTADGGMIFIGGMSSDDTYADGLVLKISSTGLVEWAANYGTGSGDRANSVAQTADGGYIIAGITNLYTDTDYGDFWVAKLTALGDIEWSYVYRGPGSEAEWMNDTRNVTVRPTPDGDYVLAGDSTSFGAGGADIWVLKLSSSGDILWQRTYGGPGNELFFNSGPHIQVTEGNGIAVACTSDSFGAGGRDGWIFKVSAAGDLLWQEAIGGPGTDMLSTIRVTGDGGFVLGGSSGSFGEDGYERAWLVKTDAQGTIAWQRIYGQGNHFGIQGVDAAADGSFYAGGFRSSSSSSGSWYSDNGRDAFVMRVSAAGEIGVPGGDFASGSGASVTETNAVSQDTAAIPLPGIQKYGNVFFVVTTVSPQTELLSWNLLQPPLEVALSRVINRGLFKGEASNTVQWSPNPWNDKFGVSGYRIYRRSDDVVGNSFSRIAAVSPTTLAYVDPNLGVTAKYSYYVTCIDVSGIESPVSATVRN